MQTHWLLNSATKLNIAQNWARGRSAAPKRAMSYRVPSEVIRKSGLKRRKRTTNEEAEEAPDLSPAQVQDGKGKDPLYVCDVLRRKKFILVLFVHVRLQSGQEKGTVLSPGRFTQCKHHSGSSRIVTLKVLQVWMSCVGCLVQEAGLGNLSDEDFTGNPSRVT